MNTPSDSSAIPASHKFFNRRNARRGLLALGILITLVALFYTEEDWRGKHAWENLKRDLVAKGISVDWSDYIPQPVPEDQNFFGAPNMQQWLVGRGSNELTALLATFPGNSPALPEFVPVAELTILTSASDAGAALKFDDPSDRAKAWRMILDAIGPYDHAPQGYGLLARPVNQIEPAKILLLAGKIPTLQELTNWLPFTQMRSTSWGNSLRVTANGDTAFRVELRPSPGGVRAGIISAADYLAGTDPLEADFDLIREAAKRPYARMNGSYQRPDLIPIVNFVCVRSIVQVLAGRAQCDFLLRKPEAALRELTLVDDLCRMMLHKPEGKPMPLIDSMINVAVRGLYANTVADGLRLHAWQEPQLIVLQEQLKEVDLPLLLQSSMRSANVAGFYNFGRFDPALFYSVSHNDTRRMHWDPEFWLLEAMPKGWVYQNTVAYADAHKNMDEALDVANRRIQPHLADSLMAEWNHKAQHFSPYTFIATTAFPNYARALQTTGYHQTLCDEALVACGLERYKLQHGQYPESLDALVPKFIDAIPTDIIGGGPLKYRVKDDGAGFVLYSVGWNEKDDGGENGLKSDGTVDVASGDWVWPQ